MKKGKDIEMTDRFVPINVKLKKAKRLSEVFEKICEVTLVASVFLTVVIFGIKLLYLVIGAGSGFL